MTERKQGCKKTETQQNKAGTERKGENIEDIMADISRSHYQNNPLKPQSSFFSFLSFFFFFFSVFLSPRKVACVWKEADSFVIPVLNLRCKLTLTRYKRP